VSAEAPSDGRVLRRLFLSLCIGGVAALAIAGASVVVQGKLKHIPSQPPRETISTKAVPPPPIALPLVLQANPPVPSIAQTPPTTTKPATATKPPARGGKAKGKKHRTTAGSNKPGGTQP
jgi:hypothetical protein